MDHHMIETYVSLKSNSFHRNFLIFSTHSFILGIGPDLKSLQEVYAMITKKKNESESESGRKKTI